MIKLLDHWGGACTSSKQAASSKQQASTAGPFLGPRATGTPKWNKNVTTLSGMVFRNFLGKNFLSIGTPPIGNGDLLGFGLVRGPGHLEKFRAWAENRKMLFPGARGTFEEKICPPQKFLPEIAQIFYVLRFGRLEGREIAKYWLFGATLGHDSPWHLQNFWAKKQTTGSTPDRTSFQKLSPVRSG